VFHETQPHVIQPLPSVGNFDNDLSYNDYDEFVPLSPTPSGRRPIGNRIPIAIITTPAPQPSPTPSSPYLSTAQSLLPTYPHFEPLYQEGNNPGPAEFESAPSAGQPGPPTETSYSGDFHILFWNVSLLKGSLFRLSPSFASFFSLP